MALKPVRKAVWSIDRIVDGRLTRWKNKSSRYWNIKNKELGEKKKEREAPPLECRGETPPPLLAPLLGCLVPLLAVDYTLPRHWIGGWGDSCGLG